MEWIHSPTMIFAPPSVPGMARLRNPWRCCAASPSLVLRRSLLRRGQRLVLRWDRHGDPRYESPCLWLLRRRHERRPPGGSLGLGCGNPIALASLRPGGVWISAVGPTDCFLAARAVGRPDGSLAWI